MDNRQAYQEIELLKAMVAELADRVAMLEARTAVHFVPQITPEQPTQPIPFVTPVYAPDTTPQPMAPRFAEITCQGAD